MRIRVPDLCDEIDISSMIESHRYFDMDRESIYTATTKLLKIFPKKKKKNDICYICDLPNYVHVSGSLRDSIVNRIKFLVSTLNKLLDKKVGVASCRSLFSYVYAF